MPEKEMNKVTNKLRSKCEKYSNIKVPHTQRKIISDLSKRDDIVRRGYLSPPFSNNPPFLGSLSF